MRIFAYRLCGSRKDVSLYHTGFYNHLHMRACVLWKAYHRCLLHCPKFSLICSREKWRGPLKYKSDSLFRIWVIWMYLTLATAIAFLIPRQLQLPDTVCCHILIFSGRCSYLTLAAVTYLNFPGRCSYLTLAVVTDLYSLAGVAIWHWLLSQTYISWQV